MRSPSRASREANAGCTLRWLSRVGLEWPEAELAHGGERGRVALPSKPAEVVFRRLVSQRGSLAVEPARFVKVSRHSEADLKVDAEVADGLGFLFVRSQARKPQRLLVVHGQRAPCALHVPRSELAHRYRVVNLSRSSHPLHGQHRVLLAALAIAQSLGKVKHCRRVALLGSEPGEAHCFGYVVGHSIIIPKIDAEIV